MTPYCPLPEPLYPCSQPHLLLVALALAHILDLLYPRHHGLLLRVHPVHTAFVMIRRLAPPYSSRLRGAVAWTTVTLLHLAVYTALLYTAWAISPAAWILAAAYIAKTSFSLTLLIDTLEAIARAAEEGDEQTLRKQTQTIVRRNVWALDTPRVRSAAVESLAESLVDGYTSPTTYYILAGPLGALLQRIINAMDSAVGYKHPQHRQRGWLAAKTDTIVNYIPARLTALAITLACLKPHRLTQCLKQAKQVESPNARHPLAAIAACTNTTLEKPQHYRIQCGPTHPTPEQLRQAIKTTIKAAIIYTTSLTTAYTLTQLPQPTP